jgi:hypothetical protein
LNDEQRMTIYDLRRFGASGAADGFEQPSGQLHIRLPLGDERGLAAGFPTGAKFALPLGWNDIVSMDF